jgi:hypothetical protein
MTVGRSLATPARSAAIAPAAAHDASPGKTTAVLHEQTGIAGVDDAGKRHVGAGYFLDPAQRAMLVGYTQGRIQSAQDQFSGAVSDVRSAITAESDAELSPLVSIVLGAIAGTASIAIQGAVKFLASHGHVATALQDAAITGVEAAGDLSDVSEGEIEAIVGASIDQAKDSVKPGVAEATAGVKTEKAEKKSYVDELSDKAVMAFFHLREDPPHYASDAQLLALCQSFRPEYHMRSMYREKLETSIKRYMGSMASKIGRRAAPGDPGYYGTQRETGVAWIKGSTDAKDKLVYVAQDFKTTDQDPLFRDATAYTTAPMESLGDVAHDRQGAKHQLQPEGRPMYMGDVEPDLVEAAVARHKALWLHDPETYTYDMLLHGGDASTASSIKHAEKVEAARE